MQIELELLAPAKNKSIGIAAIDCGADAVYIAGPRFGAREAAGNTLADIAELVGYAAEKGIFVNNKGTVTSLISKQEFYSLQSEKFVDDTFGGSLPAFIAAFSKRKKLSKAEIEELRKMINDFEEE